jgi:hypothetical protein
VFHHAAVKKFFNQQKIKAHGTRNCGGVTRLLYIIQNIDSDEIICRAFR